MPPEAGETEEASRPVAAGDAGCGAVVAEQGVGARPHLGGPRGGEAPVEKEAEVAGSAEGERRERGGHDVGLFPRGHGGEEPEAHLLENAGAEDPLALALDDAEGELEWGRGVRGAALGLPDRPLGREGRCAVGRWRVYGRPRTEGAFRPDPSEAALVLAGLAEGAAAVTATSVPTMLGAHVSLVLAAAVPDGTGAAAAEVRTASVPPPRQGTHRSRTRHRRSSRTRRRRSGWRGTRRRRIRRGGGGGPTPWGGGRAAQGGPRRRCRRPGTRCPRARRRARRRRSRGQRRPARGGCRRRA
mmetsp:Transcript_40053/g.89875  ORF Transcript_40053/g.89875 Transcript_40053/m.89875 type:complete len:300 (-) Transcript_40053:1261-2160(-)